MEKIARGSNFNEEEKLILISLISHFTGVVENLKKTDGVSIKEKQAAWRTLRLFKYECKRSVKTFYDNFKRRT